MAVTLFCILANGREYCLTNRKEIRGSLARHRGSYGRPIQEFVGFRCECHWFEFICKLWSPGTAPFVLNPLFGCRAMRLIPVRWLHRWFLMNCLFRLLREAPDSNLMGAVDLAAMVVAGGEAIGMNMYAPIPQQYEPYPLTLNV